MFRMPLYILTALFFSTSSLFAAGLVELPATGQATCYDDLGTSIPCTNTGQDGAIQAGAPWPSPRLIDLGNGSVIDTLTGLMWTWDGNLMATRDPDFDNDSSPGDGRVYWNDALAYIDKLNTDAFLGFSDWRLPNVRELESLVNAEASVPALPAAHPFGNVQYDGYWSGTTSVSDTTSAWVVNMNDGALYYSYKGKRKRYVWPVRLAQGSINGAITHNGNGLEGVTVTLSGSTTITTATDADGAYILLGLADNTYTVTPSLQGYLFSPQNLVVTVQGFPVSGRDFTASCQSDMDSDTVCDLFDNCPNLANLDQKDCDGDGAGDLCDPDPFPTEVCDGIDNNCDGQVDEGVTNICGTCGPIPTEICDGVDNNCDGQIDEGLTNICGTCGPVPTEVCDGIDNNCDGQVDEGVLNACGTCGPVPTEACDGTDNNCDGLIDEGCSCTDGQSRPCGSDVGECQAGVQSCTQGIWETACAGEVPPGTETCDDLLDNDCDGEVDEDCTGSDQTPADEPTVSTPLAQEQESAQPASGGGGRKSSGGGGCSINATGMSGDHIDLGGLLLIMVPFFLLSRKKSSKP